MTTKFISLASAIVILDVYLQSQLHSNDPLFLFASNNLFVNMGMVLLAALTVAISFKAKFRHWASYLICCVLAAGLVTLGIMGTFFSDTIYSFPSVLLPLNYLFLLQAGVIIGLCTLTYQHQSIPYRLSNLKIKLPRQAFPVLKTPYSPLHQLRNFINQHETA